MATMQLQVKKRLGVLVLIVVLVAAAGTAHGVCVDLVDVVTASSNRGDLVATFVASGRDGGEIWRRTLGPGTSGSFGIGATYQFVAANSEVDMCVVDPCRLTLELEKPQDSDFWIPFSVRIRGYDSENGMLGERTFTVIPPDIATSVRKISLNRC